MKIPLDLKILAGRESEQVEWKENVADCDDGLLLQLLAYWNVFDGWDRRPCEGATLDDLQIYQLVDLLKRIKLWSPDRGAEVYLSDTEVLSPMVPPLCVREPLTGVLRPRNFTMLLFGRNLQRFVPGALTFFSQYGATTRSQPLGERHELFGTLLDQADRLVTLLDSLATTLYDKEDTAQPSVLKYPARALREASINALVHRNYQSVDPLRVTAFSDRVEIASPGPLPLGLSIQRLRSGKATPVWRNQALAWFFNRLGYAEAEGQGIRTMLDSLRAVGCPPPRFEANEARVICTIKAHPRAKKVERSLKATSG